MRLKQPQKKAQVSQQRKTSFRSTSKWKKFRKRLGKKQEVDFITEKELAPGWQVHHMNLDPLHYEDLQNENEFLCLNKASHDVLHWLWKIYERDPYVLDRLEYILERMRELNLPKT